MVESDVREADRIMRLAFGTFLNMPDPMRFMGDAGYVATRWKADPSAAFCAEAGGILVGSVFVGNWGSVGFFGPLTIHPDYWDRHIGQLLMQAVVERFDSWGTRHAGLYTFANSLKHAGLYRKFGFWPRFLTMLTEKAVGSGSAEGGPVWQRFSAVLQADLLEKCRAVTGSLYPGLDLTVEIKSVAEQGLGETVVLFDGDELAGLAVCHCGAGTEAGSGVCYIKFGCVRTGQGAEQQFRLLLRACEQLAAERGLSKVVAGVNTARHEACVVMLDSGYRAVNQGIVMERPNEPGYNRPGVYAIDDWR
jgi:GNAT superfamily N-acetyltransferase